MADSGISLDSFLAKMDLLIQATNAQVSAIKAVLPYVQSTATAATAGAAALPANPLGFINATLPNGTPVKIPYYAP